MKESICHKLDQILKLKQSLQMQLSDQSVVSDMENYQRLSKELHQVLPVADAYERYLDLKTNVKEVSDMLLDEDADSEMKAMAQDELDSLHVKIDQNGKPLEREEHDLHAKL